MADVAEDEQQAGPPPNRLWAWLTGLQLSQLSQIGTLIVLAATAMFGGLDTVDNHVTVGKPGTAFSDGQYSVTIERASLVPELRVGSRVVAYPKPGQRYLGVVMKIRNDGTIPGTIDHELELIDLPEASFYGLWRLADAQPMYSVGPGLTDEVAFLWSLPEDALAVGDSVKLRVWNKTFNELLTTYGKAWIPSETDYTVVTVPVTVPA